MYAVRVESVSKSFGGVVALRNVSMSVRERSVTLVIGPNGSGKSTLLNIVSGIYQPDSGRVYIFDVDVTDWPPHERARLGVARTFQNPRIFPRLTVLENMLVAGYGGRLLPGRDWRRVEGELVERAFSILKALKLDHLWDMPASKLSGGQAKLLELGRALMRGARLLLMDEPLAGVNPALAHEIMSGLLRLRDRLGITMLIIEHRLDIVTGYVDYVYAMANGQVIAEGSADQVMKHPAVIEAYLGGYDYADANVPVQRYGDLPGSQAA